MTIQQLCKPYGIKTAAQFARKTGMQRQRGWQIWNAQTGIGSASMKLIHEKIGIPYELLFALNTSKTPRSH